MTWVVYGNADLDHFNMGIYELKDFKGWDDLIKKPWRKNHVRHFMIMPPGQPASHLCMIEGPHEARSYMLFGSAKIFGSWLICSFQDGKPTLMHCESCASEVGEWLQASQEGWKNAMGDQYVQAGVSLYH